MSETFCLLGLLNSGYSNGSRLTKTNFVLGLVSLDCRLRLLEKISGSFSQRNGFIFLLLLLEPVVCPLIDHKREPIKMQE